MLEPERIPFISHPYEWCFGQLKDAALLTLHLQQLAVRHGMTLRDASAFNVQFRGARPVFIDTLSFGRWTEGEPWIAYRQFCQHFLVPLLLMSAIDPRLGLLAREHLDGIPLDLGAALLPWRSRWRPSIALHVHLHARTIRRHADRPAPAPTGRGVSRIGLLGLIDNLEAVITRLDCRLSGGAWWDYEETHGYDPAQWEAKGQLVTRLAGSTPGVVWDLGANTGRLAELVEPRASHVVAMDLDHGAVERHWRRRRESPARILPLVMDLANPSPDLGWAEGERGGLSSRGPADTILALALVHHLAIGQNLPLARVADWMARAGRRLVIEWVPKEDPQVQRLLRAREDWFDTYHEAAFREAFLSHFQLRGREPIPGTGRILYLFERA